MKGKVKWPAAALCLVLLWNAGGILSTLVMAPVSAWSRAGGFMAESGLDIRLPGGFATTEKDWRALVLGFDASEGFSKATGRPCDLFIYYNFGSFDGPFRGSVLKEDSPYAGAFYGAYIVRDHEGRDRFLESEGLLSLVRYDYQNLVLKSLGCPDERMVFKAGVQTEKTGLSKAGFDGWRRFDGELVLNGMGHRWDGFRPAYLQYGLPTPPSGRDFNETKAFGRLYAKRFDNGCTVVLYALGPSEALVEAADSRFLSGARIVVGSTIK